MTTGFAARYDLEHRNISFDFFAWQTHAVILGATEIVFGIKNLHKRKQPVQESIRRYRSIIKPGPALLGLPSREGDDGVECATHKYFGIMETKRWDFPRLKSVLPPGNARYTVTLRNVPVHPERNSPPLWREFAKKIGAVLIEDFGDRPIDLHERVALYAGAKMNFGVINGPLAMLFLSPYPLMMCQCDTAVQAWGKHGVKRGEQLPWFLPGQSLVWEKPTIEQLMAVVNKIARASLIC